MGKEKNGFVKDLVSVCICTFKRPQMLKRTVDGVISQITNDKFLFEIVVIDNDKERSAEKTIQQIKNSRQQDINYDFETEQSISLARNRAVKNAKGNFIAFIDDDEFPAENWLFKLYEMYEEKDVDGVLGPVIPHFDVTPPEWIVKSKVCERNRLPNGTIINNSVYTRTGNVLISSKILKEDEEPFKPMFGRSGGGDVDFFKRKMEKGASFAWCDEAIVYETVPLERQKKLYYLKRAFTRGMTVAKNEPFISLRTVKSLFAVFLYTVSLPVLFILGEHLFMKYLIKNCDHLSKLLAYCKIKLVKNRPY